MPVFIAAIGGMLVNIVATLAGRVLVALGIAVITFTGVNASLNWMKSQALSSIGMLPPEVIGMLGTMKVGVSISIVTSAITARLILNGISGDTFKRWVHT
jgi:hypothetical protein